MSGRAHPTSGFSPLQTHFSFLPTDTVNQLTVLWQDHYARAEERAAKRLERDSRKRVELKVIDSQTLEADWRRHKNFLDLPLFRHEPSDLDIQPAEGDDEEAVPEVITGEPLESPVKWTDDDVEKLHRAVLHHSLHVLKSKGNAEEKYESLRWIWAPDVFCWVTKSLDGVHRRIPIYRRQLPFMFETCCAFDGQRPDVLREGLAHILRPVLRGTGMESLIN
jgi:hypothetical protein